MLEDLTALGVSYDLKPAASDAALNLAIGARAMNLNGVQGEDKPARQAQLKAWLENAGYDFSKQTPPFASLIAIVALLMVLGGLSGLTYGPVAALLSEMFPPKIRYSSMSIPYHIGAGYLGGFLPLIASYIVAKTGNAYSGLWYTWVIVAIALVVSWWGLKSGPPRDFEDDAA